MPTNTLGSGGQGGKTQTLLLQALQSEFYHVPLLYILQFVRESPISDIISVNEAGQNNSKTGKQKITSKNKIYMLWSVKTYSLFNQACHTSVKTLQTNNRRV